MSQSRTVIDLDSLQLPALVTNREIGDSVIILLHGSEVSKEVNMVDMGRLEEAGFWSVAIDAPHHGDRNDGYIDIMQRAEPREYFQLMLAVVHQEASEVAELIKFFKSQGKKVAVVGISMGAYATHALMMINKEADLYATFMGNPDFRCSQTNIHSMLETSGPADNIDKVFPASLFIVNAGSDDMVDPNGARNFYHSLKPYYESCPERLEYLEFPESGHLMRAEDWFNGWDALINRLRREGF